MYIDMDVSLCPCLFGNIGHQMSYIFVFKCATIQHVVMCKRKMCSVDGTEIHILCQIGKTYCENYALF